MRIPYLTPGLIILGFGGAIVWFIWTSPADDSSVSDTDQAIVPSPMGVASRIGGGQGTGQSTPATPFLASHEQESTVVPSSENVAASFHIEMEALKRKLESAPQDTLALIRLARLKQDGHQLEEAIDYYRQYLVLHPEGRQARLDLTQCYGQLQQWAEALEITEGTLDIFPDDPGALYNQGAIYANTGRYDEARSVWHRVVQQMENLEMQTLARDALTKLGPASE